MLTKDNIDRFFLFVNRVRENFFVPVPAALYCHSPPGMLTWGYQMREGGGVTAMTMHESGEMYLEAIYVLQLRAPAVRSLDVAEYLGYSKPSVSRAVSLLKQADYITVDPDGHINLTESGAAIAEKIYDRHITLAKVLVMLGVDEKTAAEDACKMEHDISDVSFAAIKKHIQKFQAGNG